METLLTAINVCVTCIAAILSYLSFKNTERAQQQDVNIQLLGKRENAFLLLKNWYDIVSSVFSGDKVRCFDILLAFRNELLSNLKNEEIFFYSGKLMKYDSLCENSNDPEQINELKTKQRDIFQDKWIYIIVYTEKMQREIDSAEHIFSVVETDVNKIRAFTRVYCTITQKIATYEIRGDVPDIKQQEKLNANFKILREAHRALNEAKILETLKNQLNELKDSFGG